MDMDMTTLGFIGAAWIVGVCFGALGFMYRQRQKDRETMRRCRNF